MTASTGNQGGSILKSTIRISVLVGLSLGFIEALIISFKVLASNDLNPTLFSGLIMFLTFSALLFAVLVLIGGFFAMAVLRFLPFGQSGANQGGREIWILRFCWFFGMAFLFGVWINYNSDRYPLATDSLLYDLVVVIGAGAIGFLFTRFTRRWAIEAGILSKGRMIVLGWLSLFALAYTQNLLTSTEPKSAKPNVILLIVDTLRADRLGCYGYDKNTTPVIDELAKAGVLFEQTYVQWASSLPSHASIMTSTYPHIHGAFPNGKNLNPKLPTLAKILKEQGYTSGAFVSNSLVGNQYNFQIGFDTFIDLADFDFRNTTITAWIHSLNLVRVFDRLTNEDLFTTLALSWLEKHQSEPVFLWMQWLYPHAPYRPPSGYLARFENEPYRGIADGTLAQIELINKKKLKLSPGDEAHYTALYDAEVAFSDYQISRIIDKLRELNVLENSLVIVTADHGENLNEHGMEYGHYGVYDSSVRIPLVMTMPKTLPAGKRVPHVIQSLDIAPTILDVLEIPRPQEFQGKSVRPLISEENPQWESVAYSVMFRDKVNFLSLRSDEWKMILKVRDGENHFELYHVPSDHQELIDRLASEPAIADSLKQALSTWIETNFQPTDLVYVPGTYFKEDFDKATIDRLRALGYIK